MLAVGAFGYLGDFVVWLVLYASLIAHAWCFFRFFPQKKYRKSGLVLGNGLIFACLLGSIALVGESYYRYVCVETDAFGMSLPARRWFVIHTTLNSLGCRDKEWAVEKPDGVRRIAFVGDSFSYGWGIERAEDRFPDRIQAMFDKRAPGTVEIMNVAKPGWDTGAQLQPIVDMIRLYEVDEVVLCYVPNDIEKLLPRTSEFDPIRPPQPSWFNPDSSYLLDHLYRRVVVPRVATVSGYHDWLAAGFGDPEIWRRHRQQLYDIIRYCQDRNVAMRVVLVPFIRTSGERFKPAELYARLLNFFETNQIPAVDLLPAIADMDGADLVVNSYDAHPNERAHELFAEKIWTAFYATKAR